MYMMQECTQSRFLPCASITFCISSLLAAHKYSCKCMYVCLYVYLDCRQPVRVTLTHVHSLMDTFVCVGSESSRVLLRANSPNARLVCLTSEHVSVHTHTHRQTIICALVCALCKRLTHSCCCCCCYRRGSCTHRCNNARLQRAALRMLCACPTVRVRASLQPSRGFPDHTNAVHIHTYALSFSLCRLAGNQLLL